MDKVFYNNVEKKVKTFVKIFDTLDNQTREVVLDTLSKKVDSKVLKNRLNIVKDLVKEKDVLVRKALVEMLTSDYVEALNYADKNTGVKGKINVEAFYNNKEFVLHRNALNILIKDSYLNFGNTMVAVVKGVERTLNDVMKREIRAQIAAGEMLGSSIPEIAKDVRETLADNGFRIMINKKGSQWTIKDYSEMLIRTNLIKTANEGVVNRMVENGHDIVEWSATDDERECDVCGTLDGKMFSLSGQSSKYEMIGDLPGEVHPNCRCSLLPRPELDEESSEEE